MIRPPAPAIANPERIRAVRALKLLNTQPEEAFDRLTLLASQVLEAPIAMISLIDEDYQFVISQVGFPDEWAQMQQLPLSQSLCAHVVESNQPLVIENGPIDERFAGQAAVRSIGVGAFIGVPITMGCDATVGTLCVVDHQPRSWRPDAAEILQRLADSVVSEVELRSHMRDVSNAYDNLVNEHSLLRKRTSFLDSLLHGGADMLGILNADGEILYASPGVTSILGYDPDQILGQSAFALIHPADQAAVERSFEKVFDLPGVGLPITFRFRHARSGWRYLEAVGTNHLKTPAIEGIVINARDVTERMRLERLLGKQNQELKALLASRTEELNEARYEILERLAVAAEYRDDLTGEHTRRVGRLAGQLATLLGCSQEEIGNIVRAAPLHDVGKIGISDQILLKPGRLTADERAIMERHTLIGARILSGSQVPCLQMAMDIALSHHERWDGTGYPHRLAGTEIPRAGRIVAVADVLDALSQDRPYKQAWTLEAAIEEIASQRGRQFDPAVVDALLTLYYDHRAGAGTLEGYDGYPQPIRLHWQCELPAVAQSTA